MTRVAAVLTLTWAMRLTKARAVEPSREVQRPLLRPAPLSKQLLRLYEWRRTSTRPSAGGWMMSTRCAVRSQRQGRSVEARTAAAALRSRTVWWSPCDVMCVLLWRLL